MLNKFLEFCTSSSGMLWLNFYSDLATQLVRVWQPSLRLA